MLLQTVITLRAIEAGAQCTVIGPVCVCECYHNSKLRASILTKLGLWVKVVTICHCILTSRISQKLCILETKLL